MTTLKVPNGKPDAENLFVFYKKMHMEKLRLVVVFAAFLASSVLYATERTWNASVTEGWLDEPSNWSGNTAPSAASDLAKVMPSENTSYRIFVPTTEALFGGFNTYLADGSSVEYVGTNRNGSVATFSMPALEGGVKRLASPLQLFNGRGASDGSFLYLNAPASSAAIVSWTNPWLKASASGGAYEVVLGGGALNLYNPGGVANAFDLRVAPYSTHSSVSLVFCNDETHFAMLRQFAKSARSSLAFTRGTHTIHTSFRLACETESDETSDFVVSNTATVALLYGLEAGTKTLTMGENRIVAANGGTLDMSHCTNKFEVSGNTRISAVDGGTLRLPGDPDKVKIGAMGGTEFPATVAISGSMSRVSVGKAPGKAYGVLRVGCSGPGAIEVDGGTFGGDGCGLDVALGYGGNKTAGSSGVLKMTGGRLNVFGGNAGLDIGGYDTGEVDISGGEIVSYNIRLGLYPPVNPGTVSRLKMTGGFVVCTNAFAVVVNVNDYPNRKSYLQLDGGVLEARRIYGKNTQVLGFKSPGYLEAEGGTIRPNAEISSTTATFLEGFDAARLGPKGLTVDAKYNLTIAQRFENKVVDDVAADGLLRKTGPGTLTLLSAGSSQSRLEIASGMVALGAGATLSATVSVTNGAAFDVSASPVQSLGGLVLGDGTTSGRLVVSEGTCLTLATAPSCPNGEIALSGTFGNGTYAILKTSAAVPAAYVEAWCSMKLVSGRAAGHSYNFTVSESEGVFSFNLVVATPVAPDRVVTWPCDLSVLGPDAIMAFGVGGSAAIDGVALVGSIDFPAGSDDWTIAGSGTMRLADTGGYGLVSVSAGNQRIELPVVFPAAVTIHVESGASLTLTQGVVGGGIVKTGGGRLVIPSASDLPLGVETRGGTVAWSAGDEAHVTSLVLAAATATSPLVVSAEADVTVTGASVSNGALIKRGVGRLEFGAESGTVTLASGAGSMVGENVPAAAALDFGDGRAEPTAGFGGFNVFEGEVRLRGTGTAWPTFVCDWQSQVGIRSTASVFAAPGLVVDHANADFDSGFRTMFVGVNAYEGEYPQGATSPYVYVTNHATLTVSGLEVGRMTSGSGIDLSPRFVVADHSSLIGTKALRINRRAGCSVSLVVTNASSFSSGRETVFCTGPTIAEFLDESSFSGALQLETSMNGYWAFRSGSVFSPVTFAQYGAPTNSALVFDGGQWNAGTGDFDFCLNGGANVKLVAEGGGLVLDVPAAKTWRMYQKVQGTGAVVKRGEGLLTFECQCVKNQTGSVTNWPADTVTLDCAGGVRIEAGSVAFAVGAGAGPVSGTGSVVNSSLTGLVLLADGETVPTLSNCVLNGSVKVDFAKLMAGVTERPYPTDVAVARLANGTAFVASQWRGRNVGKDLRATFRLDGDTVRATVNTTGLRLIVR